MILHRLLLRKKELDLRRDVISNVSAQVVQLALKQYISKAEELKLKKLIMLLLPSQCELNAYIRHKNL